MSSSLSVTETSIPATSPEMIGKIRRLEEKILRCEQFQFRTEHVFHAGMYARTVRIPAGVVFTSVLIKCPTLVILNGTCDIAGGTVRRFDGYNVVSAEAGRKMVYITRSPVEITMLFATNARTVEEAEAEFTDETENLLSHVNENDIVVTEAQCQESQPQLLS